MRFRKDKPEAPQEPSWPPPELFAHPQPCDCSGDDGPFRASAMLALSTVIVNISPAVGFSICPRHALVLADQLTQSAKSILAPNAGADSKGAIFSFSGDPNTGNISVEIAGNRSVMRWEDAVPQLGNLIEVLVRASGLSVNGLIARALLDSEMQGVRTASAPVL